MSTQTAPAVVINNGVIAITNHTTNLVDIVLERPGFGAEHVTIERGQTWHSSACCFAAGSEYALRVWQNEFYKVPAIGGTGYSMVHAEHQAYVNFRPRLCQAGVPYGFAAFTVVKTAQPRDTERGSYGIALVPGDPTACYQ